MDRVSGVQEGDKLQRSDTPDKRYIIIRGRLWRASNPNLPEPIRQSLVNSLMQARRAVRALKNKPKKLAEARALVNRAKMLLGERGAVWWDDGTPDYNRILIKNSPYDPHLKK